MTSILESSPNEVLLDLIQEQDKDTYPFLKEIMGYIDRVRLDGDPAPSLHAVLDGASPQQRGIPHGKHVLDKVRVRVFGFVEDRGDLWKFYQTIKQIIVGNNQVQSTTQYANTGIEWSMLQDVDFDYILTGEFITSYFDMVVEINFQDDYN